MKTIVLLIICALFTLTISAQAKSYSLMADQPLGHDWNTLADWQASDGTNPTAITATDDFFTAGFFLRTPASAASVTFGGKSLSINGGGLYLEAQNASAIITIPTLNSSGGTIANGADQTSHALNLASTTFTITGATTVSSAVLGFNFNFANLLGTGNFILTGGGKFQPTVGKATQYTGTLQISGNSTLKFQHFYSSGGGLRLETGSIMNLTQVVTIAGLTIGSTGVAPGAYPYATLAGTYPATFPSGSGTAGSSITTYVPGPNPKIFYLSAHQTGTHNWNSVADWSAVADGVVTHPASIAATDDYDSNGFDLLTPSSSTALTFGGNSLTLSGGNLVLQNTTSAASVTIGNFVSQGGTIANGSSAIASSLIMTNCLVLEPTTIKANTGTTGLTLTITNLSGNGKITFTGGSLIQPFISNWSDAGQSHLYEGTMQLTGGSTLKFQQAFYSGGPLIIDAGTHLILTQALKFTQMTIAGTVYGPGTYSNATLAAAYPAIFTGGNSNGSITVYTPVAAPPHLKGVNLAGTFFGAGTWPTAAEMNYYQGKGLNLIRLPIAWEKFQPTLMGSLNAAEMTKLDAFMALAHARNMKVIIDLHNYDRYTISGTAYLVGSATVPYAALQDFWNKMAAHYATETAIYAYGIMNEPHGTGGTWPVAAQSAINGIRAVDTTHYILVAGDGSSSASAWAANNPTFPGAITDNSHLIIYEAHTYWDGGAGVYASTYNQLGAYPNIGIDNVSPFVNWLKANHVRGFIGEYGIPIDYRWNSALNRFYQYIGMMNGTNGVVGGTYWAGGIPWAWPAYNLSCEPNTAGADAPQMEMIERYNY